MDRNLLKLIKSRRNRDTTSRQYVDDTDDEKIFEGHQRHEDDDGHTYILLPSDDVIRKMDFKHNLKKDNKLFNKLNDFSMRDLKYRDLTSKQREEFDKIMGEKYDPDLARGVLLRKKKLSKPKKRVIKKCSCKKK